MSDVEVGIKLVKRYVLQEMDGVVAAGETLVLQLSRLYSISPEGKETLRAYLPLDFSILENGPGGWWRSAVRSGVGADSHHTMGK